MTESTLQQQIVQALQARGVFLFSVPNEGHGGNPRRAMHLKAMGQRNGVSDIVVILPGRVVFMEVKLPTGKQSENQHFFEETVTALGHRYVVVRSVEEALEAVR